MIKLGIDEAGRGPVIGPMVICGAEIDNKDEPELRAAKVRDSKTLSPKQRQEAARVIKKIAKKLIILKVSSAQIDASLASGVNLNQLEGIKAAEIIGKSEADGYVMDCPSNNILAYSNFLGGMINYPDRLVMEHQADKKHICVAAASIIAKVTRDAEIERIKQQIGADFGSGYPSDPKTVEFLRVNYDKHKGIFRTSWASYKKVIAGKQSSLGDF